MRSSMMISLTHCITAFYWLMQLSEHSKYSLLLASVHFLVQISSRTIPASLDCQLARTARLRFLLWMTKGEDTLGGINSGIDNCRWVVQTRGSRDLSLHHEPYTVFCIWPKFSVLSSMFSVGYFDILSWVSGFVSNGTLGGRTHAHRAQG